MEKLLEKLEFIENLDTQEIDINELFIYNHFKKIKFKSDDQEKVKQIYQEWEIRKNLEKLNPFLTGQEKAINYSRIQYLKNKIIKLAINIK